MLLPALVAVSQVSWAANPLPRGVSAEQAVPRIQEYQQLVSDHERNGNLQSLLLAADVSYLCDRTKGRLQTLMESNDVSIDRGDLSPEDALVWENRAAGEDAKILNACHQVGVVKSEVAENWVADMADQGYLPALLYYAKNPPPSLAQSDDSVALQYQEISNGYITKAIEMGSGEAMFIRAAAVRPRTGKGQQRRASAIKAYSWASAAAKCGYNHPNVHGLMHRLMNDLEHDAREGHAAAENIAQKFCAENLAGSGR